MTLKLNQRQLCDIELLLNGGFNPLDHFMKQNEYDSVVEKMLLPESNSIFPMPICLDVDKEYIIGEELILEDEARNKIAKMIVEDIWQPNKEHEAKCVFGTLDQRHPGVDYLLNKTGKWYIGGSLEKLMLPVHYDFCDMRLTPAEVKQKLKEQGIEKIVAFQTRNPLHRSHVELTKRAAKSINGYLLLHPVVGMTKPGDVDHFTRVKCYKELLNYYDGNVILSLLPLAMRMGGPREALWHAIIRRNYGATHFIIGRDHAGPGHDIYDPYAAQELVKKYEDKIGIKILCFQEIVYVSSIKKYMLVNEVNENDMNSIKRISGTQLRNKLSNGEEISEWFSFPEVINQLRKRYPKKENQGFTIFLTGLSGAGKSTIAEALIDTLMQTESRAITLLDGDEIRTHLSSELGFSKEHRDLNIIRIGYVSSVITKSKGISIVSAIAPRDSARKQARQLVEKYGRFILVHVSTSLEVCEKRDKKGLYKKARDGVIKGFTGIDDPYEQPLDAEVSIDTNECTVREAVMKIIEIINL